MSGVLYIVATPIGNLEDLGARALSTLRSVALIAAEDTRHSRRLLEHYGVATPMISCHEHNEAARSERILAALAAGDDVALISDAGTPLISDPGFRLVRAARDGGYRVSPVPGACSVTAALSAAGLPTDRFHFCGFLSSRAAERERQLRELRSIPATLALFEAGRRLDGLLGQLATLFGDAECVLAKELTKLHERILSGSAEGLRETLRQDPSLARGEFVVLLDNRAAAAAETPPDGARLLVELLAELPVKKAVDIAARVTGGRRNALYRQALELRGDDRH